MSYRIAFVTLIILAVWLHFNAVDYSKSTAVIKASAKPATECGEWK